ncbi:MAG: endolytic transglycosylase MltG [Ferruginibacter sp.]
MKKILLTIVVILLLGGVWVAYNVLGPVVSAPEGKYFYIPTGSKYETVMKNITEQKILPGTIFFNLIAKQLKYPQHVKPGRYEIKNGSNLISLIRMLNAGNQSPVRLVINKLRTKEDLAKKIGDNFEADEQSVFNFINSNDSLKPYSLDTNTVMTAIIPDTYLLLWNSSFKKLFSRLNAESVKFWNKERLSKAAAKNLTPVQVYTISSIVDEETNIVSDKGLVASVYINRINKGMKLQADPTVKYALRNFGLKRILYGHLTYPSSYNTYYTKGLPPGPIGTALPQTLDAVLDAPETNFLFFAAKPDLKGYHAFSETYEQHKIHAKAYQHALDSIILRKQQNQTGN